METFWYRLTWFVLKMNARLTAISRTTWVSWYGTGSSDNSINSVQVVNFGALVELKQ